MMKASKTFVHQYADVAIVVGLLSTFGIWTVTRFVTASSAQPALAAAKPLLVQRLADLPGREVRITLLDRAPGSSAEIIEKLNREINVALADRKIKAQLADLGNTAIPGSPADFGNFITTETEKWGRVIRAANIKPD